jgi:16S rRNA (cytosine967-C5)-methyltransferase
LPAFLKPTNWPGFFLIEPGHWREAAPLLAAGTLYVQDPSTRLAVDLLAPKRGETVIDLCAAPGGKSIACADRMEGEGMIIAVDLPGLRQDRLEENLARITGVRTRRMGADISSELTLALNSNGLPQQYTAILLDVPCSNTGVMRHRIDVKERLEEADLARHAVQQHRMLLTAARLLAPGGRLVYSTCSIEPDENINVVKRFIDASKGAFVLETSVQVTPWEQGHDGAGAFLIRRA